MTGWNLLDPILHIAPPHLRTTPPYPPTSIVLNILITANKRPGAVETPISSVKKRMKVLHVSHK